MTNKKGKGRRSKTRSKFKRKLKRGPLTIQKMLRTFETGSRVHIGVDPSVHAGLTDKRFVGLTGQVVGKRGRTGIIVQFNDQNKQKQFVFSAAHLTPVKAAKAS